MHEEFALNSYKKHVEVPSGHSSPASGEQILPSAGSFARGRIHLQSFLQSALEVFHGGGINNALWELIVTPYQPKQ